MLFNSWHFAAFLPIVFILYWCLNHKFRWFLLLIASYYFYMSWNAKYLILILFTTLVSYVGAIIIEKYNNFKKIALFITLISCLGVLFVFKYFNFFSETIINIFNAFSIRLHPVTLKLMLPVGISFYTFQTLSYVIDVYRNKIKAERHFGIYAAFISFFPQLVAGPIERTENLLPQIRAEHNFNYNQATYGLKLMAWGFFKKLVIADNLAGVADKIYGDIFEYQGFTLILASLCFTAQIYCDFSGYSDIARGTSKLMGIELMENFRAPYLSQSIREFWSRWHISLSTWFRDYVYIPLGGNRVSKIRHNFNLLAAFLLSGLWHGANWTFVIWGGIHGAAQIFENLFMARREARQNIFIKILKTFLVFIFISTAWIFFRAQNIGEALYIFSHMFSGIGDFHNYIAQGVSNAGWHFLAASFFILFLYDYFYKINIDVIEWISRKNIIFRWLVYIIFVLIIAGFAPLNSNTEFIYFQF